MASRSIRHRRVSLLSGLLQTKYPNKSGRFPQVSNITYTFDPSKEPGSRIVEATLGGGPMEMDKKYTLATRGYMGRGKGTFKT